jgi:predicted nucleotidyltransferase component of viral defense system
MNHDLITRSELEVINKKNLRYPLAVAEKDYFLALVSKIIYDSALSETLVFKGGTAIYHCYLPQLRFSENLDFTSLDNSLEIETIKSIFTPYDFIEIKEEFVSPATIKIKRLKYAGPLNLPNFLKIEVDKKQNVVLPAKKMEYKNFWKVDSKITVMDIKEICAEKIRALSDRARYRDFYDLCSILDNFGINIKDIFELVRQKEIRKTISKELIASNWKVVKQEKKEELKKIYYSLEIPDSKIEDMLKKLVFEDIL